MSETEEFTTNQILGKKTDKNIIEKGREWKAEMIEKGCEETPDGMLPLTEIRKAGYRLVNGVWTIPGEWYIADGNYDRPAGQKYFGPAKQYLDWRRNRNKKTDDSSVKDINQLLNFINKEKATIPSVHHSDEIDVDAIPF